MSHNINGVTFKLSKSKNETKTESVSDIYFESSDELKLAKEKQVAIAQVANIFNAVTRKVTMQRIACCNMMEKAINRALKMGKGGDK